MGRPRKAICSRSSPKSTQSWGKKAGSGKHNPKPLQVASQRTKILSLCKGTLLIQGLRWGGWEPPRVGSGAGASPCPHPLRATPPGGGGYPPQPRRPLGAGVGSPGAASDNDPPRRAEPRRGAGSAARRQWAVRIMGGGGAAGNSVGAGGGCGAVRGRRRGGSCRPGARWGRRVRSCGTAPPGSGASSAFFSSFSSSFLLRLLRRSLGIPRLSVRGGRAQRCGAR